MTGSTGVLDGKTIRMDTPALPRRSTGQPAAAPHERKNTQVRAKESLKRLETKAFSEAKSVPGVSVFAIMGTLVISILMVFVVLAQISYNETASESARLSTQIRELSEKQRMLELAFESSFDIREVERVAKDELGMSRPEAAQILTITAIPGDTASVIIGEEENKTQGFAEFLKSLTNYFRN